MYACIYAWVCMFTCICLINFTPSFLLSFYLLHLFFRLQRMYVPISSSWPYIHTYIHTYIHMYTHTYQPLYTQLSLLSTDLPATYYLPTYLSSIQYAYLSLNSSIATIDPPSLSLTQPVRQTTYLPTYLSICQPIYAYVRLIGSSRATTDAPCLSNSACGTNNLVFYL